jgi:V8-like Glu-specific endopeptidase
MEAKGANFKDQYGETINNQTAIVPLISQDPGTGKIFFIGTAFYISGNGLMVTAKHCLYDKDEKIFDNLGVYHFFPDNNYILRPITQVVISNDYDIAYLLPKQILHKGKPFTGTSLILTESKPEFDDQLGIYGYPLSRIDYNTGNVGKMDFVSQFYLGRCREYHANGFSLLKNPCYQTSIQIMSGASGGPVFDKNGHVFAVCSTGYDLAEEGEDISFVTPISPSFNITIPDGSGNALTIRDLIGKGFIDLQND